MAGSFLIGGAAQPLSLAVKIEEVLGEKEPAAAATRQPLLRVRATMGLIRRLLVELLPALLARELLHSHVEQRVPLEASRVGEGLGALLTDVGPQAGLTVVVQVTGHAPGK